MEKKIRLELIGITYNQIEYGVYALVLQEVGGNVRIPIIIGNPEAQAIECKLQEIKPPRPLTHDTMLVALSNFGINLKEVNIKKLPEGVFGADLILTDGIEEKTIDSRASDAISLAIRVNAPIYTSEEVIKEAGFKPNESTPFKRREVKITSGKGSNPSPNLNNLSIEELTKRMEDAVKREDYEEAAKIKLEIDERNKEK